MLADANGSSVGPISSPASTPLVSHIVPESINEVSTSSATLITPMSESTKEGISISWPWILLIFGVLVVVVHYFFGSKK